VVQYRRGFLVLVNVSVGRIARGFAVLVVVSQCWEFLGGGFGVGWFGRLRDCVLLYGCEGGRLRRPAEGK
jgi:hypothetical protein